MNNIQLKTQINKLQPWYQQICFNDEITVKSSHSKLSGELAWRYIKQLLPKSLDGMRILDLGSNAGLFSVRCAQMGAKEVIGIENSLLHIRQSKFLKSYFNISNVKFIQADLNNIKSLDLGEFDIILAIAVLYWVGRHDKKHYCEANRKRELDFITYISQMSNYIIVRGRGTKYNNDIYYNKIFSDLGFANTTIHESESQRVIMQYTK